MEWTFTGEVIEWRGPAPYLFVAMTPEDSEDLKEAARGLIYWGQVPVRVTIGGTEFTTALFPRDGRYLVPVKVAVQRAEAIGEGAIVEVVLRLNAALGMSAHAVSGRSGRRTSTYQCGLRLECFLYLGKARLVRPCRHPIQQSLQWRDAPQGADAVLYGQLRSRAVGFEQVRPGPFQGA